ncbi:MAG: hypothetical protein ACI837_000752 [Crocinitomicaceae bacterium]|jgi:hypothetical protein
MTRRILLFALVLLLVLISCSLSGEFHGVSNPNYIDLTVPGPIIDSTMPMRSSTNFQLQPPRMEILPNRKVKWYSPYLGSTQGPERVSHGKWKRNMNNVTLTSDEGENRSHYLIVDDSLFYKDKETSPYVYVKTK